MPIDNEAKRLMKPIEEEWTEEDWRKEGIYEKEDITAPIVWPVSDREREQREWIGAMIHARITERRRNGEKCERVEQEQEKRVKMEFEREERERKEREQQERRWEKRIVYPMEGSESYETEPKESASDVTKSDDSEQKEHEREKHEQRLRSLEHCFGKLQERRVKTIAREPSPPPRTHQSYRPPLKRRNADRYFRSSSPTESSEWVKKRKVGEPPLRPSPRQSARDRTNTEKLLKLWKKDFEAEKAERKRRDGKRDEALSWLLRTGLIRSLSTS